MGRMMAGGPLNSLSLKLCAGDFVTYTIRNVKDTSALSVIFDDATEEGTLVFAAVNENGDTVSAEISAKAGEVPVLTLTEGEEWKIKVCSTAKSAQLNELIFG